MQEEKEEAEEEEETKQEWRRKGNVRLQQVELLEGAGSRCAKGGDLALAVCENPTRNLPAGACEQEWNI